VRAAGGSGRLRRSARSATPGSYRVAAFVTAGSAGVPFWKFLVADGGGALFGVPLAFGLAYFFTDQIKVIMADVHRTERWLPLAGLLALAATVVAWVWRWKSPRYRGDLERELWASADCRSGRSTRLRRASPPRAQEARRLVAERRELVEELERAQRDYLGNAKRSSV